MITVSVDLLDNAEIGYFGQFLSGILERRARLATPITTASGPSEAERVAALPAAPAPSDPSVIADISPDSIERKFREYINTKGSAAARALLDLFGVPYLKDLPAEKRAAFVAELSV